MAPALLVGFVITIGVSLVGRLSVAGHVASATPAAATGSGATATAAPSSNEGGSPSSSPSASVGPVAAVWLDAGALHEPRNATNAVLVGSGKILLVGSDHQTSWLAACGASTNGSDSVEIGDPRTGEWRPAAPLPRLRDEPAAVALRNGQALMTGGAAGEDIGWSAFSSTYVFDASTGAWSRTGLLNTARTATAATTLLDGRVLVAGGTFMDRTSPDPPRTLDTTELWSPTSGTWSRGPHLGGNRAGASSVLLADGRVLLVGGFARLDDAPHQVATTETYDPATDRWSPAGSLATARIGFTLVALADGGAIVAGGFGVSGPTGFAYLSSAERFDPSTSSWSPTADLPYPVAGAAGARLIDGRVLLAGGSTRLQAEQAGTIVSGLTADAVLFDATTNAWSATVPMPSPRAGASAVALPDGSVVVVGGSVSEGAPTAGCPEAHPQAVRYVPR
jgi:N-acetylneuraminic acid mutarotase